ncbi:MAG: aminoglycoside phosphotransferase, partial [Gammaproteobacteria bacterium]|nr:aminoglycoside phosphotransferase [Gammaproteobacteria bacterium]
MNDATLPVLIKSLLKPESYKHPAAHTELIETHISWVILTGEFAYKLKKPVDLGFLDFSTLEKRKFACAEELRLNARFAPELYFEVMPVTGSPENPGLGGAGPAIEYALK